MASGSLKVSSKSVYRYTGWWTGRKHRDMATMIKEDTVHVGLGNQTKSRMFY